MGCLLHLQLSKDFALHFLTDTYKPVVSVKQYVNQYQTSMY